MMTIDSWYEQRCRQATDINEHLPVLLEYAQGLDRIVELGTAGLHSTWAFLKAHPRKFLTVDILDPATRPGVEEVLDQARVLAAAAGIEFLFLCADTTDPQLDLGPMDLLFIDTYHVYEHLRQELALHGNLAQRYIIMHDTTLFADRGEVNHYDSQIKPANRHQARGLWAAIEEFLAANSDWIIDRRLTNNNGLTILKRINHGSSNHS